MKRLKHREEIERLQKKYPVTRYFTSDQCPYHYRVYEKGEFLQSPDFCGRDLHIILSGKVQVYSLSSAGQKVSIASIGSGYPVGEVELFGKHIPFLYVETVRRTTCLVLPVADCRRHLLHDPTFLYFLANALTEKLTFSSNIDYSNASVSDRVLFFLQAQPDHQINSVEEVLYDLHCSRSSLQRSLAALCKEGKIEKLGKGAYRLP